MNEKLINFNRKEITLDRLKSKLSYPFDHKDLRELEKIIDYYKQESEQPKERIAHKHKYAMEIEDKYVEVKAIMDELEKWLKEDKDKIKVFDTKDNDSVKLGIMLGLGMCLEKLEELEGVSNE